MNETNRIEDLGNMHESGIYMNYAWTEELD